MDKENIKAFPHTKEIHNLHGAIKINQSGMDLRDYFAAKAMQSLINIADKKGWQFNSLESAKSTIGEKSYTIADAMLKQREL